jgi:hypothetical protein
MDNNISRYFFEKEPDKFESFYLSI